MNVCFKFSGVVMVVSDSVLVFPSFTAASINFGCFMLISESCSMPEVKVAESKSVCRFLPSDCSLIDVMIA